MSTGGADAGPVDVPLLCLAAHGLEGAGCIVQRPLHGWPLPLGDSVASPSADWVLVYDAIDGGYAARKLADQHIDDDADIAGSKVMPVFPRDVTAKSYQGGDEPLAKLFQDAGLDDVTVRAIDVQTVFRNFADYWTPFLGGQAPAPGCCMSLSEGRRAMLRDRIRKTLQPSGGDASIHLIARSWAMRGTVH